MNEKMYRIIISVLFMLFVLCAAGATIIAVRYGNKCNEYDALVSEYERLNRQLGESLDRIDAEQRGFTDTVTECNRLIRESKDILSNAGSSIQELRAGLAEIEKNYREMENLLNSINLSGGSDNNASDDISG